MVGTYRECWWRGLFLKLNKEYLRKTFCKVKSVSGRCKGGACLDKASRRPVWIKEMQSEKSKRGPRG